MKNKNILSLRPYQSVHYKDMPGALTLGQDDQGNETATGYLSAFGNKDSQKDIVHTGAYTKSISERGPASNTARKIAFLYCHDMKVPLGRFTKLEETTLGLYYEAALDSVPFVEHTVKPQLKSGTLNQHSVGYNYVYDKIEYDEEKDEFNVYELEMYEGSLVTLGANPNTPFIGFKDFFADLDKVQELGQRAERLLKSLDYNKEIELRTILKSYQSLTAYVADELTTMKRKPKPIDLKYIAANFDL